MPATIADSGFLVALLSKRDSRRNWAVAHAARLPPPWQTCEAALMETFYLLGKGGAGPLIELLRRAELLVPFRLTDHQDRVFRLMEQYADVPMSLADACLVRMTETHSDPIVLTTDADFRIYRRHGRQMIPTAMPE